MSKTDLIVVNGVSPALIVPKRENYELTLWDGRKTELVRDVDFGKPSDKLKKPILYKSGAERILWDYGVIDRYEMMNSVEDFENGYFFYRFKCSLVKINFETGQEFVVKEGYGSANSREASGGNASGFDLANQRLKIAEKRAMVDAVIKLARLSSLFTQDLEDENFMQGAADIVQAKDDDPISSKQRQRIFAIAANKGLSTEGTKNWLKAKGFVSTKNIKQKHYDDLCKELNDYAG